MQLTDELLALPDHHARIKFSVDKLMSTGNFPDSNDLEKAAECFWRKLFIADEYEPSSTLKHNIRLFKASAGHNEAGSLGEDYGLKDVCEANIEIHTVEGDHDTFIQEKGADKIAQIMNEKL